METPGVQRKAFVYERDIPKLRHSLARLQHQVAPAAYFQLGDLLWRIRCPANRFNPTARKRLGSEP